MTDNLTETQPGLTVTYQLAASNNGLQDATGVVISDTLPPAITFLSASDGGSEVDGILTWPALTLAVGESVTRTITVQVANPMAAGVDELVNTAVIHDDGSHGADLNLADNSAMDATAVNAAPDLQLSLTTAVTVAQPGDVVTYSLSYENVGTQLATGTTLQETVPPHMFFAAAHSSAGWSCPDGSVAGTTCSLVVDASGSVTFAATIDPALAMNTTVTNTAVLADDGSNGSDLNPADNEAAISLFIQANDDPMAVDDNEATDEDTAITLDVLANDSDGDGDELMVTVVSQPANGTVNINPDGTLTYTPDANYNRNDSAGGADSFNYTIEDGFGGTATATVAVTVIPVNDTPAAVDDEKTTNEDMAVLVDLLQNDSDVDGDVLTITAVTSPSLGNIVDNGDGTLTYTPFANIFGTDTFSYTVSDGNGGTDVAQVTVEIVAANDAPEAADDTAVVDEDASVTVAVLANDSDIDGDTVFLVAVNTPAHGTAVANPDGTLTYTPNSNYHGADSFSYTIDDGHSAMDTAIVAVSINPVNDAPVANDDTVATLEDTAVTLTILENDDDIDGDVLTVAITTAPLNGTAVVNAEGTVTYTPSASYNGSDSFEYLVDDGIETDTAVVNITITPDNDNPIATNDIANTAEDVAVTFDVLSNDDDIDGDTITVTAVTTPTYGSISLNPDGSLTYTPSLNFNGDDSVVYTIVDGFGGADTAVAGSAQPSTPSRSITSVGPPPAGSRP
jgi:uncharacterized repeat protein (TIGR01451 family)